MNATEAELAGLQKQIAAGRRPALPEGKADEFYWHPTMRGFGLRVYANGAGRWVVQYRNGRGQTKRYQIPGSAAVITLKQATNLATIIFGDIARGLDPQPRSRKLHSRDALSHSVDDGNGIPAPPITSTTNLI